MEIISGTTDFMNKKPAAIVLGKFDGVHIGHRLLLERLRKAGDEGLYQIVFTFDKPPASVFSTGADCARELCTAQDKRRIFEEAGVDLLIEFPVNRDTLSIPAERFLDEYLLKRLQGRRLIAGEDVSFGYQGRGDVSLLKSREKTDGFCLETVDKVRVDSVYPDEDSLVISSSLIRKDIAEGRMKRANAMLGSVFHMSGVIEHGNHLGGPVLSMPTINIRWPENIVVPAFGVYAAGVLLEGVMYRGISNIGKKPTVSSEDTILAETHIFDFNRDVYGKEATVFFYEFKRPEMKFETIEALKEQMHQDML